MKKTLLLILLAGFSGKAQTAIQSVNSGALITAGSSVSVGEIVVVPVNPDQTSSGLIAILAQSQQTLAVPQLEIASGITVFPNPTVSKIYFETNLDLAGQKVSVYTNTGQLVSQKPVSADLSVDLEDLASGIYLIRFSDKTIKSFKIIKH